MNELLEVLFTHKRFNKLFTNASDAVEVFLSVFSIALGADLLMQYGFDFKWRYLFGGISIPFAALCLVFFAQGAAQYMMWYENIWKGRRFFAFLGLISITALGILEMGAHSFTRAQHPHFAFAYLSVALLYAWTYLRLGMKYDC